MLRFIVLVGFFLVSPNLFAEKDEVQFPDQPALTMPAQNPNFEKLNHLAIKHVLLAQQSVEFAPGDIDQNGIIDIFDLVLVAKQFGRDTKERVDVNGDGRVDDLDMALVATHFGLEGDEKNLRTGIVKEEGGFRFYFHGKPLEIQGIVYQPVPDGKHINDFKNNYAELYRQLLDEEEGGKGDARLLKEMGVTTIRIYEYSLDQKDQEEVNKIFQKVFDVYGIGVMLGDYAGLWTKSNDSKAIKENITKMVLATKDKPWLQVRELGNENNLHVQGGPLANRYQLPMFLDEYYQFMNELAILIKTIDPEHPLILGNGGLSEQEVLLIQKYAVTFDGVGINNYTGIDGFRNILYMAAKIDLPVIFSEIGNPAFISDRQQLDYVNNIVAFLHNNTAGQQGVGNVVGYFVHEFSNEKWKAQDTGDPEQANFGIVGKGFNYNQAIALPNNPKSELWGHKDVIRKNSTQEYLQTAWRHLDVGQYGQAIDEIEAMINHHPEWLEEAKLQNKKAMDIGRYPSEQFPNAWPGTKAWEDIWMNYWALNDVGVGYFILVKVYTALEFELDAGKVSIAHERALNAAQKILIDFNFSEGWNSIGRFWWQTKDSLLKGYPDLFAEVRNWDK